MKTTFDIPEPLLRDVQRLAKDQRTTTKSLVEEALRNLLEARQPHTRYKLPDRSVSGAGLQPEFQHAGWDEIRDTAYDDAGRR